MSLQSFQIYNLYNKIAAKFYYCAFLCITALKVIANHVIAHDLTYSYQSYGLLKMFKIVQSCTGFLRVANPLE